MVLGWHITHMQLETALHRSRVEGYVIVLCTLPLLLLTRLVVLVDPMCWDLFEIGRRILANERRASAKCLAYAGDIPAQIELEKNNFADA